MGRTQCHKKGVSLLEHNLPDIINRFPTEPISASLEFPESSLIRQKTSLKIVFYNYK